MRRRIASRSGPELAVDRLALSEFVHWRDVARPIAKPADVLAANGAYQATEDLQLLAAFHGLETRWAVIEIDRYGAVVRSATRSVFAGDVRRAVFYVLCEKKTKVWVHLDPF